MAIQPPCLASALSLITTVSVLAQPTLTAEIVTSTQDATLPAHVLVIDFMLDVGLPSNDEWTAGAIRVEAAGGLRLRYTTDPNTGANVFTVPDAGIGGRHVSFVNMPSGQFADVRFREGARAGIGGAYDPSGSEPTASANLLNLTYHEFGIVHNIRSGYTARAAFDIDGSPADFGLLPTDPSDNTPGPFGRVELAVVTVNYSFPATIAAWNIVPEPATLLLLAFGGLALRFRR